MTEIHPPLSYSESGVATGFAVELLELVLQQLGSQQHAKDVQVIPWARAYSIALVKPNTLIFSTTYAEHRDDLFRWSGAIGPAKTVVLAKKTRGIKVENTDDLKKLRLGTVRNDIGEQLLLNLDVQQVTSNVSPEFVVQMLTRDRIDGFVYSDIVGFWYLEKLNLSPADYEVVFTLHEANNYYAFSKSTSMDVAQRFQSALFKVKNSEAHQLCNESQTNCSGKYPISRQGEAGWSMARLASPLLILNSTCLLESEAYISRQQGVCNL